MKRDIGALIAIFVCTTIAWFILGGATSIRTETQDGYHTFHCNTIDRKN